LASVRAEAAREKADRWLANVAVAREKTRPELGEQALARAEVYHREQDLASAEADTQGAAIARLGAEIATLERRVAALRALRKGGVPAPAEGPAMAAPPTRRLASAEAPQDPL